MVSAVAVQIGAFHVSLSPPCRAAAVPLPHDLPDFSLGTRRFGAVSRDSDFHIRRRRRGFPVQIPELRIPFLTTRSETDAPDGMDPTVSTPRPSSQHRAPRRTACNGSAATRTRGGGGRPAAWFPPWLLPPGLPPQQLIPPPLPVPGTKAASPRRVLASAFHADPPTNLPRHAIVPSRVVSLPCQLGRTE